MNRSAIRWVILSAALASAPVSVVAAAVDAPLNYFLHSYGPASQPVMVLGWVLAALSVAVCLIIGSLLLAAIAHKRNPEDFQKIGREGEGLRWISIGTGVSTCLLFSIAVYAMITLNAGAKPAKAPELTLTVTGHDWWWEVAYNDADAERRFVTANEIHIPVGVPVLIKLVSADVIHAFWVPQLAGKTQMIPGQINQQWLQADVPGVYRGQCAQYCGVQHAHMALEVVAQEAGDFKEWQEKQLQSAVLSSDLSYVKGLTLFIDRCSGCHTVRGTYASGNHAPDLTHLNARRKIAAGLLANNPENAINWIIHAQRLKPGARMPSIGLSQSEIGDLSAFLATLN